MRSLSASTDKPVILGKIYSLYMRRESLCTKQSIKESNLRINSESKECIIGFDSTISTELNARTV